MFDFITAFQDEYGHNLDCMPPDGTAIFIISTPTHSIQATAFIKDRYFNSLRLLADGERINIIARTRPVRRAQATVPKGGVWICSLEDENVLNKVFSTGDGIEAIYSTHLFLYELELIVNILQDSKQRLAI